LLARTQPPGADRILRLPTRVLAGLPGAEVRFRVRLGGEADGVVGALRGELRRNCLPVWNVGLAAVERSGGADGPPPEIDPHPLRTTADRITVLECIDRRNGRVWHDNRFASGYDPAETFTVGPADGARRSRAALNFEPPPVSADWRILYLAGLEPLGPLRPNTSWLVGPGPEHMVVRSGVMRGPGADGTMMADFPRGEVVTGAQLVELLWRIAPAPVRRQIDDEAVARLGAEAIDVRTELDVDAAVGGGDRRRATPVTIVTLPQRLGGEDLSYWLLGMGREAGLYTRGRVEVRLEPGGGAT